MVTDTPLDYSTRRETLQKIIVERKEVIAIVLLSIVMRIPRVPGIIGDDAFIVLWMGRILSEGYFEIWTLSPFALFGLYPSAAYPIGIPLIVAIMVNLGLSFEIIVFIVSTTSGVFGTAGAYYLGRELFGSNQKPLFFTVFYSFSSVFVNFTYFTITPRGPFLAVLPWFLFYGIKYIRGRNTSSWKLTGEGLALVPDATTRDLVIASVLLALLFFIHALALFVLAYAAVVVGYYILRWLLRSRISVWMASKFRGALSTTKTRFSYNVSDHVSRGGLSNRVKKLIPKGWLLWLTYLGLLGGALILGLIFVPIDPSKTTSFIFSNNTFFGRGWNLLVDYGIRLGLLSIFLPIGVLGAFQEDLERPKKLIHFILVPPVLFLLPMSLYTSVLFLPVFGYYSVVGFDFVRNSVKDRWIGFISVGFVAVFLGIYIQYAAVLPPWTIGFAVAIVIIAIMAILFALRMWSMYRTVVGRHLRSWKASVGQGPKNFLDWQGIRIFFISVIIISLITTEGILLQGEYKYVSSDERQLFEYLGEQPEPGIVFVPTPILGRRLEAYGFTATLSFNNDASLYNGWIESSNITANSHFSITNLLTTGRLFYYSGPEADRILWNQLFSLDLTSTTDHDLALALGLEYVVIEKGPTGYSDTFHSTYGDYYSQILHSTPLACDLVWDGESLSLFRIPV